MTSRPVLAPCAIGGAAAGGLFTWMVSSGHWNFLQRHVLGGFYDAQAHSLLGGHWDIPAQKLGFEAFVVNGKYYTYLGAWMALMRLPIAAVTTSLDGRLTQLSLVLGFVVLMIGTAQLLARVRTIARPDARVTRVEQVALATFAFVVGAGSVVLFLASRPVVYHEAELWGPAWAVVAFAAILRYLETGARRAIVVSGLTTALALLSRGSIGLAPLVALALVAGFRVLRRRDRDVVYLGLAIVVPLLLYAYVNYSRFGTFFGLPIAKQIATTIDPVRPKIFHGTHGSMFAPKFVPTDVVAMFRPDGLSFTRVFPYIAFPARAHVLGNVTFASIAPSASVPSSMPFLFVLGIAGAVVLCMPRSKYAPLRVLAIGAVIGSLAAISLPFVDDRYMSDFVPLLIVLGAAALYSLLGWYERLGKGARAGVATAFGVLAAFSVLANVALALVYQRAYSPFTSDADRAAFVRFQEAAPGGSHMPVSRGAALPDRAAPAGTLFVIGDCAGVYWSDGADWHPVERTQATGLFPVHITVAAGTPAGARQTLLSAGPPGADDQIVLESAGPGRVRFVLASARLPGETPGPVQRVPANGTLSVNLLYDQRKGEESVSIGRNEIVGLAFPLAGEPIRVAGRDLPADGAVGNAHVLDTPADFCARVTNRAKALS